MLRAHKIAQKQQAHNKSLKLKRDYEHSMEQTSPQQQWHNSVFICLSRMFSGRAERMCSHGTDEEELNSFIPVSAVSSCVLSFDVCLVVVMLGGGVSLHVNDVHSTSFIRNPSGHLRAPR